jgi:hypothetical protein
MTRILRFPSIAATADAAAKSIAGMRAFPADKLGHEDAYDTMRFCREGNDRLVPEAEKLIERFAAELDTSRAAWLPDIAGAYPVVPEFLAGNPECMRRRQVVASEVAPLNIYVNIGASYALDPHEIMARGTAILAFVLAMARVRPIALYAYVAAVDGYKDGEESLFVAPVNTAPLDVATAAYALTSPAMGRAVACSIIRQDQSDSRYLKWPRGWREDRAAYNKKLLAEMGGDPENSLLIDCAFSGDALIRQPEAWLKEQIAKFHNGEAA